MKKVRELAARVDTDEDGDLPPLAGAFLRGLSLGALVGAAIAGTLLLRQRTRAGSDPGEPKRLTPSE